jgi:hypothetical protein
VNFRIIFPIIAAFFLGAANFSIPSQSAFAVHEFDICHFFPQHPECNPPEFFDLCTLVPCPDPCPECFVVIMPWEEVFEDLPILVAGLDGNDSTEVTMLPDKSVLVLKMPIENVLDGSAGQILDQVLRNETLLVR